MKPDDLLLAHAAATWALVGLIWVVQLVQYPGFALVGARDIRAYHAAHVRRITWVVAPLMGVELVTGILLVLDPPAGASTLVLWAASALLAFNWLCTAFVAVPLHGRIAGERRERAQALLVATNWMRTGAWSARGVLVLLLLRG
jgi:hypothetical protein